MAGLLVTFIVGIAFILASSVIGFIVVRGLTYFYSHLLLYHQIYRNHANMVAYVGSPHPDDDKSIEDYMNSETCEEGVNESKNIKKVPEKKKTPKVLIDFEKGVREEANETFSDKIWSVGYYSTAGNALVFAIIIGYLSIVSTVISPSQRLWQSLIGIAIVIPFINSLIRVIALYDGNILDQKVDFDSTFRQSFQDLSVSFVSSLYFIWMIVFTGYIFAGNWGELSVPLPEPVLLSLFGLLFILLVVSFINGAITEFILIRKTNYKIPNYEPSSLGELYEDNDRN